jgi:hypothetical protein
MTDDTVPTDPGQWTVYAPLVETKGSGETFAGTLGAEINYGAAPGLELTVALPAAFLHRDTGWTWGAGDLQLSAKYRLVHDEDSGFSLAVAPALSLPTASHRLGNQDVTVFLPVWAQQDIGPWSVYGGAGYTINPVAGMHDYWVGGLTVTRQVTPGVLLGAEFYRQGSPTAADRPTTAFGVGASVEVGEAAWVIASGGPLLRNGGRDGFHASAAMEWHF